MTPRPLFPEPRHHHHPYHPMPDVSVADEMAFAAWPEEQQRIARAVLEADIREQCERDGERLNEEAERRHERFQDDVKNVAEDFLTLADDEPLKDAMLAKIRAYANRLIAMADA